VRRFPTGETFLRKAIRTATESLNDLFPEIAG